MSYYLPLSEEEEAIGRAIVNAAYKVHTELGPGLLENNIRSLHGSFAQKSWI